MSNYIPIMTQFLLRLIDGFVYALFISTIVNTFIPMKKIVIYATIISIGTGLMGVFLTGQQTFGLSFLLILLSTIFILRVHILKSFLSMCILSVILIVLDFSICTSVVKLYQLPSLEIIKKLPVILTLINTIINLVILLITLIIKNHKLSINVPEDIERKKLLGILINSVITFTLICPNIVFLYSSNLNIPISVTIFNITSLLVFFFLGIYNTYKNTELKIKRQEVENHKIYINELGKLLDNLNVFKHDFQNSLQTMYGYLQLKNYDKLREYFQQLMNDTESLNNMIRINPKFFNNPTFYGLLVNKIEKAEKNNILVITSLFTDVDHADIQIYHLNKILGILLDNAIEAEAEEKNKKIIFYIQDDREKNQIIICIENNFNGSMVVSDIYKKGYSTKEKNTGIGLWEVKNILRKYKHITLETKVEDNKFKQKLIIPKVKVVA